MSIQSLLTLCRQDWVVHRMTGNLQPALVSRVVGDSYLNVSAHTTSWKDCCGEAEPTSLARLRASPIQCIHTPSQTSCTRNKMKEADLGISVYADDTDHN